MHNYDTRVISLSLKVLMNFLLSKKYGLISKQCTYLRYLLVHSCIIVVT